MSKYDLVYTYYYDGYNCIDSEERHIICKNKAALDKAIIQIEVDKAFPANCTYDDKTEIIAIYEISENLLGSAELPYPRAALKTAMSRRKKEIERDKIEWIDEQRKREDAKNLKLLAELKARYE